MTKPNTRPRQLVSLSSWADPSIENDFTHELQLASNPVHGYGLDPNSAFSYINSKKLHCALFRGLDAFAPLHPVPGFEPAPLLYFSPPPSGSGNRVGLVITEEAGGAHRIFGTNILHRAPSPSARPLTSDLLSKLRTSVNHSDTTSAVLSVLDAIVDEGWCAAICQVEREAERFRTMPIFVAIAATGGSHFYCTSAHAHGPRQSRFALEFAGEVR